MNGNNFSHKQGIVGVIFHHKLRFYGSETQSHILSSIKQYKFNHTENSNIINFN